MEAWNALINTAILGTGKMSPGPAALPPQIADSLVDNPADPEESLLRQVAVLSVYRRSGVMPLTGDVTMPLAAAETQPYCSAEAAQALTEILAIDNMPLLEYWLSLCMRTEEIVPPEFLDRLLPVAARQKAMRLPVMTCGGRRGEWLCALNPDWNFKPALPDDELWTTGTLDERKEALQRVRKSKPADAIALLQRTWSSEDAASKAAFLELLRDEAGDDDLPFLENLLGEKSKKVKEAVLGQLKEIPGSSIVRKYWEVARQSVLLKTEKILLGLKTKETLQIALTGISDELYKTGIEKVSSDKGVSDADHVLFQLVAQVPPHFWEAHFNREPGDILALFQKEEQGRKLLPAIALAATRFKSRQWAALLAKDKSSYYPALLPLLPLQERYDYMLPHFSADAARNMHYLITMNDAAWTLPLAEAIFKFTAANYYQYNRSFYSQNILFIPKEITEQLDAFRPAENYHGRMWDGLSGHIRELIALSEKVSKSFPSSR